MQFCSICSRNRCCTLPGYEEFLFHVFIFFSKSHDQFSNIEGQIWLIRNEAVRTSALDAVICAVQGNTCLLIDIMIARQTCPSAAEYIALRCHYTLLNVQFRFSALIGN